VHEPVAARRLLARARAIVGVDDVSVVAGFFTFVQKPIATSCLLTAAQAVIRVRSIGVIAGLPIADQAVTALDITPTLVIPRTVRQTLSVRVEAADTRAIQQRARLTHSASACVDRRGGFAAQLGRG
jgi:hypothetical protein